VVVRDDSRVSATHDVCRSRRAAAYGRYDRTDPVRRQSQLEDGLTQRPPPRTVRPRGLGAGHIRDRPVAQRAQVLDGALDAAVVVGYEAWEPSHLAVDDDDRLDPCQAAQVGVGEAGARDDDAVDDRQLAI